MRIRTRLVAVGIAVAGVAGTGVIAVAGANPVAAAGPGVGTPWVVVLGDSYISGEAGRWAGNTNTSSGNIDALGSTAYYDNATDTAEQIPNCHRSKADEVYIGGGVNGLDLACSGAKTGTATSGDFKPGLDFYSDAQGRKGQALMLQQFASTNNVKLVVVSIGGNNFNFASIVQSCVTDFLLSPSWWPDYCNDDSSVKANFTASNVAAQTAAITQALRNVQAAMSGAGYAPGSWDLVVQTYPSPIPNGSGFRYSQSGYTRQSTGGCGFWNKDADWANATALTTINGSVRSAAGAVGAKVLELSAAFNGRRLCENTVGLLEEKGLSRWTDAGASDKTEWINQIRTLSTVFGPYQVQESIHPNYWGQLALRNCVRLAWNSGVVRGGSCTISGTGKDAAGEPNMVLG